MGEKRERVKQKLYDFICDEQYKPMRLKDIRFLLQVKDADKKRVEEALNELVEEGKITVTPKSFIFSCFFLHLYVECLHLWHFLLFQICRIQNRICNIGNGQMVCLTAIRIALILL